MPYTPPQDVQALIHLCSRFQTRRYLEIGCNRGETLLALSERFPSMQLVGVDPGALISPLERSPTQLGEYLPPDQVGELVAGRRNVTVWRCRADELPYLPEREHFDGIFIDGDHRQAAVEHDARLAFGLIRRGGWIAWHDCDNPALGVMHAIKALGLPVQQVPGTWLAWMAV